jgi:uncharacterized RDD family membrane protein YckC
MVIDIGPVALVGWIIAPALVFALAYPTIVQRLSLGLLSPYAKADARKRLYAALLDGFLVLSVFFASVTSGNVAYAMAAAAYALLRDGVHGQSFGKFILGLVVINIQTGEAAGWQDSIRRNAVLLLPGANLAAVVLETRMLLRDPQGQRLGDRFAQTQVIEGAGAAELLREFQEWLMAFDRQLGRDTGRRDVARVRDRAA